MQKIFLFPVRQDVKKFRKTISADGSEEKLLKSIKSIKKRHSERIK